MMPWGGKGEMKIADMSDVIKNEEVAENKVCDVRNVSSECEDKMGVAVSMAEKHSEAELLELEITAGVVLGKQTEDSTPFSPPPAIRNVMKAWLKRDAANETTLRQIEGRKASPLGKRTPVAYKTPKISIKKTRKVDSCKKVKKRIQSWETRIECETVKQVGLNKADISITTGSQKGRVRSTVGGSETLEQSEIAKPTKTANLQCGSALLAPKHERILTSNGINQPMAGQTSDHMIRKGRIQPMGGGQYRSSQNKHGQDSRHNIGQPSWTDLEMGNSKEFDFGKGDNLRVTRGLKGVNRNDL